MLVCTNKRRYWLTQSAFSFSGEENSSIYVGPWWLRRTGFNPRPGHSWIFACGNRAGCYRWWAGFLGNLPLPPSFHFGIAPYSPQSLSSYTDLDSTTATNFSHVPPPVKCRLMQGYCRTPRVIRARVTCLGEQQEPQSQSERALPGRERTSRSRDNELPREAGAARDRELQSIGRTACSGHWVITSGQLKNSPMFCSLMRRGFVLRPNSRMLRLWRRRDAQTRCSAVQDDYAYRGGGIRVRAENMFGRRKRLVRIEDTMTVRQCITHVLQTVVQPYR
ncbi:hypothetical protein PR048_001233 [Dryococelus australis]|uniref:Uncharacterized protein n=1 Tax=Dryococelus australis TaxID=614101 RepID=A0ABQ9IGT0_9NEOP|nr:hypothetical protein PR048_001233 [Dryococelus australis]